MRWLWIAAAVFLAAGVMAPLSAAWANCYESCQGSCKSMSGQVNSACVTRCNSAYCSRDGGGGSQPTGHEGAIAFSLVDGGEGVSWNKGTVAEANRAALAQCARYGHHCRVVMNYARTCASLGVAKGARTYTTATADTKRGAMASAQRACERQYGVCLADIGACSP